MCGLVALLNHDGRPVDRAILSRMTARLSHRGPDADGLWISGPVGLGHRRLWIIDEALGAQPMTRDDVTVVFNGEIYNYVELREDLTRLGHPFTTRSDTEVLLRCYLQYGPEFARRLNGMFAFVIHDARNGYVVAGRDHFGIKPLYRARRPGTTLYASEIKALLVHPEIEARVDPVARDDYLTMQHSLSDRTMFSGIERLPPAHVEILDADGAVRRSRYWTIDYTPDASLDEAEALYRLRDLLRKSVRRQLRSDVPLGAHLSGGLDSSTVAVLAAAEYGDRLQTFTGAFREGPEFDESHYAAEVAAAIDAEPHLIVPTVHDFVESISSLAYAMDEPAAGPGLFPQYMVSRLASDSVKVCLGGQGGDEIFGGYARYLIAYLEAAIRFALDDEVPAGEGIGLADLASSLPMLRQYRPLLERFFSEGAFAAPDRRYFSLLDRSAGVLEALTPEVRATYDIEGVLERFSALYQYVETDSYLNRMTAFDLQASLPALLQVEDRVSMAVSLESRVPLLDPDTMDFVASVPPALKWRHGEPKYLFRRAVEPWLPASILGRADKMGFPVPLHLWIRGEARDFVCDILLSQRARDRGLVDPTRVEQLLAREGTFARGLWGLLQLELWHRNFIDIDHHISDARAQHATVIP
jgi:asparagine synthase (glutamine-hydrolysing)